MSQCQLSVTLNGRHLKLPDIKAGARGEQTWSGKGSVIKRVITLLVDCKEKHQQYTWFKPKPNDIFIMPRSYMWKISVDWNVKKDQRQIFTHLSRIEAARDFSLAWLALSHPSLLFTAHVLLNTNNLSCQLYISNSLFCNPSHRASNRDKKHSFHLFSWTFLSLHWMAYRS